MKTYIRRSALLLPVCAGLFLVGQLIAQQGSLPLKDTIAVERNFRNGYYFYNQRNFTAAVSFFDQSISIDPYDHRSRIWLGQAYYMSGFLKNAYTEWQTALNLGAGGNLLRNRLQTLYAIDARE